MAGHIVPDHTGPMTHASSSPHLQSCTLQMKISEKKDPAHTDRRRPNVTAHSNHPDHHNIIPALDSSIGPDHRLPPFDLHYYPADEFSLTDLLVTTDCSAYDTTDPDFFIFLLRLRNISPHSYASGQIGKVKQPAQKSVASTPVPPDGDSLDPASSLPAE